MKNYVFYEIKPPIALFFLSHLHFILKCDKVIRVRTILILMERRIIYASEKTYV